MDNGYKVPFKLNRIVTVQYAVFPEVKVDDDRVNLETSLKFGADDQQQVRVSVSIRFDSAEKVFLLIEIACDFEIHKQSWDSFQTPEGFIVPKALMSHLAVIAVGTTRGALHAKTENTSFNDFIVPTINVSELITEDVLLT
jgi:hypothetical protein